MNFQRLKAPLLMVLGAALAIGTPERVTAQIPDSLAATPVGAPGVVVDTVVVRGAERIEPANIQVVSTLQSGSRITPPDVEDAIQRLMATGNFEWVEILSREDETGEVTLFIDVQERPFIVAFEIEGLERVSASTVRDTVGLNVEQPLRPQVVMQTERIIRDLLGGAGVQLASFDTAMVAVPDRPGAYRFTFQVEEGNRLAIAEIDFVGNQAFGDDALRGAINTKEEGFLWFRQGRFDRTVLQEDLLQNLPQFYGASGYIDFAVVSDTLIIDPTSGKARLEIAVDEGDQYHLGEFTIEGARRFPTEQLEPLFTSRRRSVLGLPFGGRDDQEAGQIFDRAALDAATAQVEQLYRNEGYLYVDVEPIIQRTEGENGRPTVNVVWAISEQSPFYVDKIEIAGNTYTHESVIRDRIVVYPGDVYSEDRVLQSYRSIAGLGFFETPLPTPDISPNPETGTVDLTFRVEERQTGSINFGTSIGGGGYGRAGGLSGFLGYSQPNLFGQAKQASVQAEYGYGRSSFTASYTDPALFGTRNSGSVSLYHTDDRYRGFNFSDGRYVRTGGSLRYGFPVGNFRWTRAFAGYSLSRYSYQARNVDECEPGNIFCQPDALASTFSLAVTRDTKDHPMFPSTGTRQNLSVQQTGGLLGGDGNFQKATAEAEWWVPVAQIGGSAAGSRPIVTTFGFQARLGTVFGDAARFPLERFFLGGTQFGQVLRGYEESTVTPLGYFERDNQFISSNDRLGDAFLVLTGEYAVRLSDAISTSVFAEAGNIWNHSSAVNPMRLFRSMGVGATVVTPFGPLGLDLAYGFDREPAGWKFHFKINQPGF